MLDPQNTENAENFLVPLAGVLLICLGVVLLTFLVVKITRQGGFGTIVIWLLLSGLSGLLGISFITIVRMAQVKLGTGELGLTNGNLMVFWGAFAGCLVQGLWSGIRAEKPKGKANK
jgi:hypothetical protein